MINNDYAFNAGNGNAYGNNLFSLEYKKILTLLPNHFAYQIRTHSKTRKTILVVSTFTFKLNILYKTSLKQFTTSFGRYSVNVEH